MSAQTPVRVLAVLIDLQVSTALLLPTPDDDEELAIHGLVGQTVSIRGRSCVIVAADLLHRIGEDAPGVPITTCRCGRQAYLQATDGDPRCPGCEYLPCATCDCTPPITPAVR